jgi:hypothetical protein
MFVAVAALITTVMEARANRKHQRLSLSPALVFWENSDWGTAPQGLVIRNAGVGPAFVDSVVVFDRGSRLGLWDDNSWESVSQTLAIPDSVLSMFVLAMFERGAIIRQGGEWLLCGFTEPSQAYTQWVDAIHDRFGFALWYRSAYDEERRLLILAGNVSSDLRDAT